MKEEIVARGFHKFFNLNEREETQLRNLTEDKIKYPLIVEEKSNGYLGLISVYEKDGKLKWFISSKTAPLGEYAEHFKKMILPFIEENEELKKYIYDRKITLLFEVVDPQWDPHIEKYDHSLIVFLNVVKNIIDFELDPEAYSDCQKILGIDSSGFREFDEIILRSKIVPNEKINSYKELVEFIDSVNSIDKFSKDGIEGYVFIDSDPVSPFMFKLKSDWYKFWKYMRTLKDQAAKLQNLMRDGKAEVVRNRINEKKKNLNSYEDNKFWNWMTSKIYPELDPNYDFSKSIIEIREMFLEEIKEDKKKDEK